MSIADDKGLILESFYRDKSFRKFKTPIKFCPSIKLNLLKFLKDECGKLDISTKGYIYFPSIFIFVLCFKLIFVLWQLVEKVLSFLLDIAILKITYFNNRNSDSAIIARSFIFTMISLPIIAMIVHEVLVHIFKDLLSQNNLPAPFEVITDSLKYSESKNYYFTLWIPVFSLIYWSLRKRFSDQWTYCADLYNRTSFGMGAEKSDALAISYQRATLALDLLQTDLYAHKSFYSTFNIVLEKAIKYAYVINDSETFKEVDDLENIFCTKRDSSNVNNEIHRFLSGDASYKQAGIYIAKLQNDLDDNLIEEIIAS